MGKLFRFLAAKSQAEAREQEKTPARPQHRTNLQSSASGSQPFSASLIHRLAHSFFGSFIQSGGPDCGH